MSDAFSAVRALIRDTTGRYQKIEEMVKGARVPYYRRGEMSIPAFKMKAGGDVEKDARAESLKLMSKAAQFPIDFFFYDLEDASPDNPEYKVHARKFVIEALNTNDFGSRVVAFRPNNIRTPYMEEDLLTVLPAAGAKVQAMVIPKTETADEIRDWVKIIKDIQRISGHKNMPSLEVLIESPKAFTEAEKIAAVPEVAALIFGAWDFARTIGGRVEPETWIHDQAVARQMLPIVAAAYGKEAVDAVTGTLPIRPKAAEGTEEYAAGMKKREQAIELARRDALDARRCGYSAKWILHPDQIDVIQGAWTPNRKDAEAALKLAADYARAALRGSGAEVDGDRLADKAVVGTDWWLVKAALRGGVLSDDDVQKTGFSMQQLERSVRTHD